MQLSCYGRLGHGAKREIQGVIKPHFEQDVDAFLEYPVGSDNHQFSGLNRVPNFAQSFGKSSFKRASSA